MRFFPLLSFSDRNFALIISLLLQVKSIICVNDVLLRGSRHNKKEGSSNEYASFIIIKRVFKEQRDLSSTSDNDDDSSSTWHKWVTLIGPFVLVIAFAIFHYRYWLWYTFCARQRSLDTPESNRDVNRAPSGTGRYSPYMTNRERSQILAQIFPKSERWRPQMQQRNNSEDNGSCSICLSSFKSGVHILRGATCQHMFHYSCCMEWMEKQHDECPYCRQELFTADEWRAAAIHVIGESRVFNMELMLEQQVPPPSQSVELTITTRIPDEDGGVPSVIEHQQHQQEDEQEP